MNEHNQQTYHKDHKYDTYRTKRKHTITGINHPSKCNDIGDQIFLTQDIQRAQLRSCIVPQLTILIFFYIYHRGEENLPKISAPLTTKSKTCCIK